jgi:hypothetical protein
MHLIKHALDISILNMKLLKHLLKHDPETKYSSNIIQI